VIFELKNIKKTVSYLLVCSILASCSTSNQVISNKLFQKRKYQKGWHVNSAKSYKKDKSKENHTSYDEVKDIAIAINQKKEVAIVKKEVMVNRFFQIQRFTNKKLLAVIKKSPLVKKRLVESVVNIDFNRVSLFSAADYALNISYARNLIFKDVYFGVNAKIVRRTIGDFAKSWGVGLDAGIQYQRGDWKFGLMVRDISTTFNIWTIDTDAFAAVQNAIPGQNQELPEATEITKPKVQFGVARTFNLGRFFHLLTEADLNMRFARTNDLISTDLLSIDPALGFQLDYENFVFLRAGVGNFQNKTEFDGNKNLSLQPNFGVGFIYNGIQIDYALTNIGSIGNALFSNIFSITFDYTSLKHKVTSTSS